MPKMAWNRSALHDVLAQGATGHYGIWNSEVFIKEKACENRIC